MKLTLAMKVAIPSRLHTDVVRREREMEQQEKPSKAYQYGKTTVIIHSHLVHMTPEEREQWFEDEWKKGNPVLKQIARAVHDCYRK